MQKEYKLIDIIKKNCTLEDFKKELWTEYKHLSSIEQLAEDPEYLRWEFVLINIASNDRADILEYIWSEGMYFDIFTKNRYLNFNLSIYDLCQQTNKNKVLDFINKATNGIKLFTEAFRLEQMDNKSILSICATKLRQQIKVKNFHQSNRDKLLQYCNENDLKYAVVNKTLDEYYFYGRFAESTKRRASLQHKQMIDMSNRSVGTDFEFHYNKSQKEVEEQWLKWWIEWRNTIKFINAPILSKDYVIFIKNNFDMRLLENAKFLTQ